MQIVLDLESTRWRMRMGRPCGWRGHINRRQIKIGILTRIERPDIAIHLATADISIMSSETAIGIKWRLDNLGEHQYELFTDWSAMRVILQVAQYGFERLIDNLRREICHVSGRCICQMVDSLSTGCFLNVAEARSRMV